MKATGIVRRIDDLGRVVIPKEIRRTLRIREGDPLEIYTATDGEVIFKKYSPVGELSAFASQYAEVLSRVSGLPVIICDKDHVIAASGVSKRELLERRVSPVLENYMESRKSYTATQATVGDIQPVEGVEHRAAVIYPIIAAGDVTGAVVMLMGEDNKVPTETEVKLDFIFFDMPGTIKSEGVMKTLSQMDYIFVPVSADRFVVESAMSFMQLFHDNFLTQGWSVTKKLAFFWTMVDKRERTSLYDVYEGMFNSLDYSVLNTRLPDSKRFRRELSENRKAVFRSTIFPSDPNLLRGSGIKELSDEICEIIKT